MLLMKMSDDYCPRAVSYCIRILDIAIVMIAPNTDFLESPRGPNSSFRVFPILFELQTSCCNVTVTGYVPRLSLQLVMTSVKSILIVAAIIKISLFLAVQLPFQRSAFFFQRLPFFRSHSTVSGLIQSFQSSFESGETCGSH